MVEAASLPNEKGQLALNEAELRARLFELRAGTQGEIADALIKFKAGSANRFLVETLSGQTGPMHRRDIESAYRQADRWAAPFRLR